MFCLMCGKEIADKSKFCPYCGERTEEVAQERFCPVCGQVVEAGVMYCNQCGTRLDVAEMNVEVPFDYADTVSAGGSMDDVLLAEAREATLCDGAATLRNSKVRGTFFIYRNRVEYKVEIVADMITTDDMEVVSKIRNKETVVFWMKDIVNVKKGMCWGFPAVTLEMKNGQKYVFWAQAQFSKFKTCISFIQLYAGKGNV